MESEIISEKRTLIREKKRNSYSNYFISSDGYIHFDETNDHQKLENNDFFSVFEKCIEEIFLPQGYPESVSPDYLSSRVWFIIQELCCAINRILTTYTIFKGIGVGDVESTALSATVTFILKDVVGMVGRITFTWWKGFLLDADCKKWRLLASVVYDIALVLELLLGFAYFKAYSSFLLCLATGIRSVGVVAASASFTAIAQHQAIRSNMGDVSAKDKSQEMFADIIGSSIGIVLLSFLANNLLSLWILFFISASLHIRTTYTALKCLNITLLNKSRMILLIKHFLRFNKINFPKIVNRKESVLLPTGEIERRLCSRKIYFGCSIERLLKNHNVKFSHTLRDNLVDLYRSFPYIISHDDKSINVALYNNISQKEIIMAYFHALVLGIVVSQTRDIVQYNNELLNIIKKSREVEHPDVLVNEYMLQKWKNLELELIEKGWVVNRNQLPSGESRLTKI